MKDIKILISDFLDFQRGCGFAAGTIRRNEWFLKRFTEWLGSRTIQEIDMNTVEEYFAYLKSINGRKTGKPLSIETVYLEMGTLKSFFGYLEDQDTILKNPMEKLTLPRGRDKKMRKIFSESEITLFLDSISTGDPVGERNRAIFELIYSSGLRAREALNLECPQVNMAERMLLVKEGKGKKDRYVPFSDAAFRYLSSYMNNGRKKQLARVREEEKKKYLFIGDRGARFRYQQLRTIFKKHLAECSLDSEYAIHSIRHSTATHLLANGAGIRYVQELLGHEDLKVTQVYTRPQVENVKAVYKTFHPRENEYYREVTAEYLRELDALKDRLLWGKAGAEQYRKHGHKKGYGRYYGKSRIVDAEEKE
jgi:integrase/recombinase XerD